jgi:DNA-binding response OmpR family regulator
MDRQRVLLLESDAHLEGVLRELFDDEALDVTACKSLAELQAGVKRYPHAAVVSDSWARGDYLAVSPQHRAEIVALANSAQLILTTGRAWASRIAPGELGTVEILEKPYDVDRLLAAAQAALERASSYQPCGSGSGTSRGASELATLHAVHDDQDMGQAENDY